MISGRCSVFAVLRHISEHSKQCSGNHNRSIVSFNGVSSVTSRRQTERFGHNLGSSTLTPFHVTMASTLSTAGSQDFAKKKNKLAFERSPYLVQHATNPVEWYPWGDEALEKAKREDRLIFLSIGYSTCHWCHVMERESFENSEVAQVMNQYFVNIKVDREERPDIDKIYMTFVQALQGRGGWPLSVFLTPDLIPFTGGTYFPPVQKYGQPGFKTVLLGIAHQWMENRSDILDTGSRIFEVLERSVGTSNLSKEAVVPSIDCKRICVEQLVDSYDNEFGGFSNSPKFPQPVNFNFLFHVYAREPSGELGRECLNMCLQTLTKIAKGGIHDHVGQGFSRYSVDARWHVPHFEKMLYDQAQLLQSYADAFIVTKDTFFSNIIDDIVTYVIRDLRHEEGGFYSAEDADSLPTYNSVTKKEGAFYVWTYDEIETLLSKAVSNSDNLQLSDIFCFHFNVKPEGNVRACQDPHGELTHRNVLIVSGSVAETAEHFNCSVEDTKKYLEEARVILFEARMKRPRPHLDDKIITAWNGLMISGLSNAGLALNNKQYIEYGEDAARFVEHCLFDKEKRLLLRSCYRGDCNMITQTSVPIHGFHVDYAFMVKGLLDLYEANFDTHWLAFAEELQDIQDELFWDSVGGGYFATTKDDRTAILRLKDDHDGAEPSSNSVACNNLLRLASYLDRTELNDKAAQLLTSFRGSLNRIPATLPELVSALLHYHDTTVQIYIAGKKNSDDTNELLNVVRERLIPGRVVLLADDEHSDNILFRRNKVIGNMKLMEGRATAYVCRHQTCSLPVTEPKQFAALLDVKQ